MFHEKEHIERLITRRLDGALSPEDELALDRMLIRSPEYRRMLEQSQKIDELCGDAFRDALHSSSTVIVPAPWASTPRLRRSRRLWWLVPGAIAACLAWALMSGDSVMQGGDVAFVDGSPVVAPGAGGAPGRPEDSAGGGPFRQVSTDGGLLNGRVDTRYYRVIGTDGNVYLIELDRLQAVRARAARERERVPLGEL